MTLHETGNIYDVTTVRDLDSTIIHLTQYRRTFDDAEVGHVLTSYSKTRGLLRSSLYRGALESQARTCIQSRTNTNQTQDAAEAMHQTMQDYAEYAL